MAGSIGPMEGRVREWARRTSLHVGGAVVGAMALGAALGLIALAAESLDPRPVLAAGIAVATLAALQLLYPALPLGSKRQVPMYWTEKMGLTRALVSWGASLSLGAFTQTRVYIFWALPVLALTAPAGAAAAAGVSFGLARALAPVISASALAEPAAGVRLLSKRRWSDFTSSLFLALVALALLRG